MPNIPIVKSAHAWLLATRILTWSAAAGLGIGLFLAYRWAEPKPAGLPPSAGQSGASVTIELDRAPLEGSVSGRKTWSLWAGRIQLSRPASGGLSNIQTASLQEIRKGILYDATGPTGGDHSAQPDQRGHASVASTSRPSVTDVALTTTGSPRTHDADDPPAGPPMATFSADRGQYTSGAGSSPPTDLQLKYTVEWQFQLLGHVDMRTEVGDRLQSESLTIIDLINRLNRKHTRRLLCDQGAQITFGGAKINANQARFDPQDRTVECLGGVRGAYHSESLQTERMFWTLKDQTFRCPQATTGVFPGGTVQAEQLTWSLKEGTLRCTGATTGTVQGVPFSTENLFIDTMNGVLKANHVHAALRIDSAGAPDLRRGAL